VSSHGNDIHANRSQRTWNTPDAIARHAAMTPGQRIKKTAELSRQAIKMARARRVDG
jgi:hypothetical protein